MDPFPQIKVFWSDLNHFGQVQIRLLCINFYNLDFGPNQNKLDTRPKLLVLDQNDLDGPISFWTHRRTRYWSCGKIR